MTKQEQAFNRLVEIKNTIEQLADEAKAITSANFPSEYDRADAYGVFNMTFSFNQYDVTLSSTLYSIANEYPVAPNGYEEDEWVW